MQVLGRIRLSRFSDESTSVSRQKEIISQWCDVNSHTLVGWAEDLDVSGGVDPFDTPALGDWLNNKPHDFDCIAAWKLDRLGRDSIRLNKLFGWAVDNGKTIVSCTEGIDLSTPVGRLIANVIAFLAEGERELIKERTKASHAKLRELGRWPGGRPAYGFRAVEQAGGSGWELVHDEHKAAVMRQIVDKVLGGQSVESVAKELTAGGEPSPSGKGKWHSQTIRQLLRSKTMLGYVTHQGVTVRDGQGNPISKGPALITAEQFDRVQQLMESRSFTKSRSDKTSPLLGVAKCFDCESSLHHRGQTTAGKLYRYYYCRSCRGASIHAEIAEETLEHAFLEAVGDKPVMERVYIPGENHEIALEDARRAVDEISALLGTMTSDTVRKRLTEQMVALDFRIATLEKLPQREATWDFKETGSTFKTVWSISTQEERRQLLLRSGITCALKRTPNTQALQFRLHTPHEILDRLNTKNPPTP